MDIISHILKYNANNLQIMDINIVYIIK